MTARDLAGVAREVTTNDRSAPPVNLSRSRLYLLTLVVGSVLTAVRDAWFYWEGVEPPTNLLSAWPFAFLVVLVLWIENDRKSYPAIGRPFDFGFLASVFWIPYLPYYLIRTRGALGVPLFLAFLALYFLGLIVQLVLYGIAISGR